MFFLKNEDTKRWLTVSVIVAAVFVSLGFVLSVAAGMLLLLFSFALIGFYAFFSYRRYKEIARMYNYLRRISSGDTELDVRDNREGELSILKSEIYTVTRMLKEYNHTLKLEKTALADELANISHQLKTPLTSMTVMSDLLRDKNLPDDKRAEFSAQIHTQLERIGWLVASLLKLSRLNAGVVEMKRSYIPVKKLIDSALQPLLIPAELKEQTLNVTGEDFLVNCDFEWTREALLNIMKNCVEHTHNGGCITISCNDNPIFSEIIISDNGQGIDKKDLPHIFTRFYRGKNSSPDSVGIGLAMSMGILKNQKGNITVESEPGQGTTFFVKLYKVTV